MSKKLKNILHIEEVLSPEDIKSWERYRKRIKKKIKKKANK